MYATPPGLMPRNQGNFTRLFNVMVVKILPPKNGVLLKNTAVTKAPPLLSRDQDDPYIGQHQNSFQPLYPKLMDNVDFIHLYLSSPERNFHYLFLIQ
jgi:hypothetical protein